MSTALRVLFLIFAALVLAGIYLTGFDKAHWLLYLPVAFLAFAGATGICPGLITLKKLGLPG